VNSTVLFKNGVTLTDNITTMASKFHQMTYPFSFKNEEGNDVDGSVDYYAPEGTIAFAVADASPTKPVFVNIIVSTEQEAAYSEILRYLAVWKVASIDAENNTIETILSYDETLAGLQESSSNTAYDYAYSLSSIFYTPNYAIPLPNILSANKTTETSASYVKIKGVDENGDTEYSYHWLSNNGESSPYNHLIAHTFTISSPGVYYIGSTAGSVSVSYIYIGDMMGGEEGEATGMNISDRFTIDYVWGTMGNSGAFGTDDAIGTVAYVLRKDNSDDSLTWVHSNIYPFFTNGTAGLYVGNVVPEGYNPTDELELTVRRTYVVAAMGDPAYSIVSITADTTDEIYDDGDGVQYYNMNNATQRLTRRIILEFLSQSDDEGGGG
ncbi:MAG: hypothetical protein J5614_02270, partial [Paludibacteraceae bacterium]|nr:hypothetical protein [Paludibacteraceae bacterium]